jgi:nucleoside-triphosphatase
MEKIVMKKIMLVTAAPSTGKTTAIQKIIKEIGRENCSGFFTEEVRKDGERTGFICITLDGERATLADINSQSELKVGRYGVEIADFEKVVIRTIEIALKTEKVLIIDEIGPMELSSEKFKEVLFKALNNEKIIIGTIFMNSHPEIDKIKKHQSIEFYHLTLENRDALPYDIAKTVKKYLETNK